MAARKPVRPIIDSDMDSLYVLPLEIIPIKTKALQRSRMIKNHHLRSVVEVFSEKETGSGQLEVEALPKLFGWVPREEEGEGEEDDDAPRKPHPDLVTLAGNSRSCRPTTCSRCASCCAAWTFRCVRTRR